ncbi:hypothetical protein CAC42_7712 [Sphaceloma murrayae]|uniref:Uncharacterized protein n=1 Tax=Sphaceloma murrayae TaxID=2082308 RepID=A0A2K1QXF8_9PEZI|nr:hypothetical protein CAC42_7712 [Sphaceloma murrayae]
MSGSSGWQDAPVEIIWEISLSIVSDKDWVNFGSLCQRYRAAYQDEHRSLWRRRFLQAFDTPACWDFYAPYFVNLAATTVYTKRQRRLIAPVDFTDRARKADQEETLVVLRDLIIESAFTNGHSKNLQVLRDFAIRCNLLRINLATRHHGFGYSRLHLTILAVLFPLSTFQQSNSLQHNVASRRVSEYTFQDFPAAQQMMYAPTDQEPLIGHPSDDDSNEVVNVRWLAEATYFFQEHMGRSEYDILHLAWEGLVEEERPRLWQRSLREGTQRVGTHWLGTHSYLNEEDLAVVRQGNNGGMDWVSDEFAEEESGKFHNYRIEFAKDEGDILWPLSFDLTLGCDESANRIDESDPDTPLHFAVSGFRPDGPQFEARGWLNPLPPQQNIPGWMKVTMISFGRDNSSRPILDDDNCWGYEGIALPGGQIIMGRWFRPGATDDTQYSGPMLWWCVDGAHRQKLGHDT